jgi:hypothetical protein
MIFYDKPLDGSTTSLVISLIKRNATKEVKKSSP